jgi:hypothetical protein
MELHAQVSGSGGRVAGPGIGGFCFSVSRVIAPLEDRLGGGDEVPNRRELPG